jgi:hypothetical protein
MARGHQPTEDLDELIDRAVDTFFVEESELHPEALEGAQGHSASTREEAHGREDKTTKGVSLDSALDDMFSMPIDDEPPPPDMGLGGSSTPTSLISSGDPDTDRAIDFAVETLFVEVPDTTSGSPETTEIEVSDVVEAIDAPSPEQMDAAGTIDLDIADDVQIEVDGSWAEAEPTQVQGEAATTVSYHDVMESEIERHFDSLYSEPSPPAQPTVSVRASAAAPARTATVQVQALRKLQEAILTLEWEISKRSVTTVMKELKSIRGQFQDDVTVDFAALSMRLVVDYLIKRTHHAHPESIRFLLDVTDFLDRSVSTTNLDPLQAFHRILARYEKYKSTVRRAEGLADRRPAILDDLEINDADEFAQMVKAHSQTIAKAGFSLAKRITNSPDAANLIRSFRFLVNRSVNRILDATCKEKPAKLAKKGNKRRS